MNADRNVRHYEASAESPDSFQFADRLRHGESIPDRVSTSICAKKSVVGIKPESGTGKGKRNKWVSLPTGEFTDGQGGNKQRVTVVVSAREDEEADMAKNRAADGTLFMALELGAVWPGQLNDLKNAEANFQVVVQANGETAEYFAGRTLERWHRLLHSTTPPHRFMLGARANPDARAQAARKRIAYGVFESEACKGASELILWSGDASSGEEQGRLLELAGTLVKTLSGSERSVRVLFGASESSLFPRVRQARIREFGTA